MLVFDVTSIESYENLENWRQIFIDTMGSTYKDIPIILIGNKVDRGISITVDAVNRDWIKTEKALIYI